MPKGWAPRRERSWRLCLCQPDLFTFFLALDHDASFISASAVASLALNAATAIFITVYVLVAQRRSLGISVCLAFAAWLATTLALGPVRWTAGSAFILNAVVFALCFFIVEPFSRVCMPSTKARPWYDFLRTAHALGLAISPDFVSGANEVIE